MKKSIFLFFAAILCAMTANAQWALMGTLTDWSSGKAMTVSGTTATCTVDLAGLTEYQLKVKTGSTWYGRNSTTISNTTTTNALNTSGGNVILKTTIPGTYTFSFDTGTKKLTVTYPEVPAPHDITIRAKLPATWTSSTISAWVWTSEDATATAVTAEKDGDYYKITKNAGALYLIFRNGADWNGDKNQTVDLVYTEDVCLQLNQSGTAKATATVIDCGAIAKDITVKAVVPGAWEDKITAWVWPTGGEGKEVTPTKDGNWYVVTENCIELNVIFKNGTGWNGDANQTVNIEGVSENACYQISALNKEGGKCSVAIVDCDDVIEPEAKPEPTPTYDYYITGSFNGWNEKDPAHGMTLDGEVYKATVTLATGENLVKVTNGTWTDAKGYSAMGAEYDEVSQGASDDNIQVDLTEGKEVVVVYNATTKKVTFEGLTEKAPSPTFDYYITGSFNGNNPKKAENGMTLDGTVYKATVTLAEGDNMLKVTDGTWENTWGANELGAAYEEVSNPNDYNNIKITLAAEKEITVIFDATAGKITFEGLTPYVAPLTYTVTVPAGTEKCYIAGNMNGWAFQEMEAVTGETNKFTITIVGAKETDEYKYACQADWAYAEVIDGGGNRTHWSELDEVTAWGKPVIVTYQLKGVGGWEQPGIELVQNPGNDKEYMLTCQAISATDAIKVVRLEDGVIKDYYGNGTVKDGVTVDVSYDGEANIKLPEGKYNFYFDTNEPDKKLWIAAATDCELATITLTTGDNSAVIAANIGNTVNVVIERSFTAGNGYYTLCVPFNMDPSVIGKAYYLGTITEHVAGEGININLEEEEYMLSAGVPYLVLPKANMSELVVENVTIQSDIASGQNVTNGEGTVKIFFEGFYSASGQTNGTTQYYVGNNGYLYNEVVDIRGLCGLFTITDENGNPLKVRARVVTREEVETGIDNNQLPNTNIQKVLENGQLIIIREGVKYNVQGQKL